MAKTTVQKWGNSYAVRLPKAMVVRHGLKSGRVLSIADHVARGEIMLRATKEPESVQDLLRGMDKQDQHTETDWGHPVGNEIA